jgi:hypothetical protein
LTIKVYFAHKVTLLLLCTLAFAKLVFRHPALPASQTARGTRQTVCRFCSMPVNIQLSKISIASSNQLNP